MSNYAISLKRTTLLLAALAFTAALLVANLSVFSVGKAGAAQLTARSLSLSSPLAGTVDDGTAAGSETNGDEVTYTFTFTVPTTGTVQAFLIDFCTTAIGACTAPTNMDTHPADSGETTISLQTDDAVAFTNAYAVDAIPTDGNRIGITNVTGNTITAGSVVVLRFIGIHNPETVGTFFARIKTFDATTTYTTNDNDLVDDGTVASSITTGISITSRVVETLGFSTTATFPLAAEGASCDPVTGSGAINLGLAPEYTLSIATTYDAYSAFRLYTNAANGAVVQYEGASLTKGTDVIDAVGGTAVAPATGTEQFGLAIDLTADGATITNVDTTEAGVGQLNIGNDYDGGNGAIGSGTFAFVADTKTEMAASSSYVTCDSYAVQYIANISPLTPAGTYTTTIVYFAVPTY